MSHLPSFPSQCASTQEAGDIVTLFIAGLIGISCNSIRGLNLFYFSWLKLDQGSCLVPWWYLPFCPLAWSLRPPWTLWTLWMLSKRIAAHISRWLSHGDQKMLSLFSNDKFCQSIFNAFPAYSMHMKVSGKITGEHRWGASRALQKEEEGVVVWFGILSLASFAINLTFFAINLAFFPLGLTSFAINLAFFTISLAFFAINLVFFTINLAPGLESDVWYCRCCWEVYQGKLLRNPGQLIIIIRGGLPI